MSFARVSGFGDDTGNFGIRVAKTGSPTVTPRPTRPPNLSPSGMIPTGNKSPKTSKSGPSTSKGSKSDKSDKSDKSSKGSGSSPSSPSGPSASSDDTRTGNGPRETPSDTANTAADSVQSGVEEEEPVPDGYHAQTKWAGQRFGGAQRSGEL